MKLVNILLLLSLSVIVSGCNTARGVGADLELLGRKMQGLDNDQVIVEGLPPENVVEVPTTYQSNQTYQSDNTYPSYDNYASDSYSSAQTEFEQSADVYSTPYESDTTYTTLPDAITYPVED